MKKGFLFLCILTVAFAFSSVQAAVIDFESVAVGSYSSLDFGDAILTSNSGNFTITSPTPTGSNALLDYDQYGSTLSFSSYVTDVSIYVVDYVPSDEDPVSLMAYDSANNLLAMDSYLIPGDSAAGYTLSVLASSAISYVTFASGGVFPGSVYWDNIEYNASAVPEPATMLFIGIGLVGIGAIRKRVIK